MILSLGKPTDSKMAAEKEIPCQDCYSDPNYAVICSFFSKFAQICGISHLSFSELQEMIENTVEVPQPLVELHIKLLRKLRRSFAPDKWEKALIKFAHSYNKQDGWELERFGYKNSTLEVKLRLLKHLMEAQFDGNVRFKSEINKLSPSDLRINPLGRDKDGMVYWCQFDPSSHIRIYKEDPDEDESWDLIARDRNGLVALIDNLCSGEGQKELNLILNEDSTYSEGLVDDVVCDTGQNGKGDQNNQENGEGDDEEGDNDGDNENYDDEVESEEGDEDDMDDEDSLSSEHLSVSSERLKKSVDDQNNVPIEDGASQLTKDDVVTAESCSNDNHNSHQSAVDLSNQDEGTENKCLPVNAVSSTVHSTTYMDDGKFYIESKDSLLAQMSESFNRDTDGKELPVNPSLKQKDNDRIKRIKLDGSSGDSKETDSASPTLLKGAKKDRKSVVSTKSIHPNGINGESLNCDNLNSKELNDQDEKSLDNDSESFNNVDKDDEQNMSEEESTQLKKSPCEKDDANNVVSDSIEEPVVLVVGEGNGKDCDSSLLDYSRDIISSSTASVSEIVEEPLMMIFGQGWGVDCDTGNPGCISDKSEESKVLKDSTGGVGEHNDSETLDNSSNILCKKQVSSHPSDTPSDSECLSSSQNKSVVNDKSNSSDEIECDATSLEVEKSSSILSKDGRHLEKGKEKFENEEIGVGKKKNNSFREVRKTEKESCEVREEDQEGCADSEENEKISETKSHELSVNDNKSDRTHKNLLSNDKKHSSESKEIRNEISIKQETETASVNCNKVDNNIESVTKIEKKADDVMDTVKLEEKLNDQVKVKEEIIDVKVESKIDDKKTESKIDVKKTESKIDDKKTESKIDDKKSESKIDDKKSESKIDDKKMEAANSSLNNVSNESDSNQQVSNRRSTRSGGRIPPPPPRRLKKVSSAPKSGTPSVAETEVKSPLSDNKSPEATSLSNFSMDFVDEPLDAVSSLIGKKRRGSSRRTSISDPDDNQQEPAKKLKARGKKFTKKATERNKSVATKNSEEAPSKGKKSTKKLNEIPKKSTKKEMKVAEPKSVAKNKSTPKKAPVVSKPAGKKAPSNIIKSKEEVSTSEAKDDENEEKPESEDNVKKPAKNPRRSKGPTLLGLLPSDLISNEAIDGKDGRAVRQSRRIAQIKIKEQEEERKAIEAAINECQKKGPKKVKDPQYKARVKLPKEEKTKRKKRKMLSEDEASPDQDSLDVKKKKKQRRRKKKDRLRYDTSNPWKTSSDDSTSGEDEEEDDHLDLYEEEEEDLRCKPLASDHEFSPESDLEKDESNASNDLSLSVRRARTAQRGEAPAKEVSVTANKTEEIDASPPDDTSCKKCLKTDHPEWILLCDKCDAGWHASCLHPALMLIPEGDWFCPPCQHAALVEKLKETLRIFEKDSKRRENDELRRKRLAYVGISLSNVLPTKSSQFHQRDQKSHDYEYSGSSSSGSSDGRRRGSYQSGTDSSEEDEPVYSLRARRNQQQSYSFNEYDQLINSAILEELGDTRETVVKSVSHTSRGKDMETIEAVNRAAEEAAAAANSESASGIVNGGANHANEETIDESKVKRDGEDELEDEEEEEEEGSGNWKPRVVPKSSMNAISIRKKPRRLNNLDETSGDDDAADSDFKGSSEEEEDDFTGSDSDNYAPVAVRRSSRARQNRIDHEFINDDSESESYESPKKKKKSKKVWTESDTESDASWGRRKRKPRPVKSGNFGKHRKIFRKCFDDSESDEEPRRVKVKKPRIKYGFDEDEVLTSRTRGKKINYLETDESEEEVPSKAGRHKKVIESDSENDEFAAEDNSDEDASKSNYSGSDDKNVKDDDKDDADSKSESEDEEGDESRTSMNSVSGKTDTPNVLQADKEEVKKIDQPSDSSSATINSPVKETESSDKSSLKSPTPKSNLKTFFDNKTSTSSTESSKNPLALPGKSATPGSIVISNKSFIGKTLAEGKQPSLLSKSINSLAAKLNAQQNSGSFSKLLVATPPKKNPERPVSPAKVQLSSEHPPAAELSKSPLPLGSSHLVKLRPSIKISPLSSIKMALSAKLNAGNSNPVAPATSEPTVKSSSPLPPKPSSVVVSKVPPKRDEGIDSAVPPSDSSTSSTLQSSKPSVSVKSPPSPSAANNTPTPSSQAAISLESKSVSPPSVVKNNSPTKVSPGTPTKLEMLTSAVSITKVATSACNENNKPEVIANSVETVKPKGPAIRVVPHQKLMASPLPPAPPVPAYHPATAAALRPPQIQGFPVRARYDFPAAAAQYNPNFYHNFATPPPPPVEEFTYVPTSPPPSYDQPASTPCAPPPTSSPSVGSRRPPGHPHEGEFSGLVSYFSSQHDDGIDS